MKNPRVEFTYTPQDFIDAQNLHWLRAVLGWKFLRTILILGSLLSLLYFYLAYLSDESISTMILSGLAGFAFSAVFLVVLSTINRLFFIPRSQRKAFSQMKEYTGQNSFTLNDETILITTLRGQTELPYTDFVKWTENQKTVILYRTDRLIHFIQKSKTETSFQKFLIGNLAQAKIPSVNFWNN